MTELSDAMARLDTAIIDVMEAQGWIDGSMVLTNWVVLTHETGFDEDGKGTSGYSRIYCHGEMDDHAAIGLLEMTKHRILNSMPMPPVP